MGAINCIVRLAKNCVVLYDTIHQISLVKFESRGTVVIRRHVLKPSSVEGTGVLARNSRELALLVPDGGTNFEQVLVRPSSSASPSDAVLQALKVASEVAQLRPGTDDRKYEPHMFFLTDGDGGEKGLSMLPLPHAGMGESSNSRSFP